jgi:hypothetical protein
VVFLYLIKATGNTAIGKLTMLLTSVAFLPCLHILLISLSRCWPVFRLSLDLFTHSALAEWAQRNTERMTKSIDEVFNNANCFDDKLRAAEIKLDYQGMSGTSSFEAIAFGYDGKGIFSIVIILRLEVLLISSVTPSHTVLKQLGESFPSAPENEVIVQELLDTKRRLSGLSESSLKSLPITRESDCALLSVSIKTLFFNRMSYGQHHSAIWLVKAFFCR